MIEPRHLPSFDRSKPRDLPAFPSSSCDLGPEHRLVFATMHLSAAAICFRNGAIPPLRNLASHPDYVALGYPDGVAKRLRTPMPTPYQGMVGDTVGLTVTPHTVAAFGSYRPISNGGAKLVDVEDMVVAVVALDLLIDARLPMLFSDRSPIREDAVMLSMVDLDGLPWDRIRKRRLSARDGDPLEAARYEAEILVGHSVPLATLRMFAVHSDRAADRLRALAALADCHCPVETRPTWFFGRG